VPVADVGASGQRGFLIDGEQLGSADAAAADNRGVSGGFGGDLLGELRVRGSEVEEPPRRLAQVLLVPLLASGP
jgi:hypothetical protein